MLAHCVLQANAATAGHRTNLGKQAPTAGACPKTARPSTQMISCQSKTPNPNPPCVPRAPGISATSVSFDSVSFEHVNDNTRSARTMYLAARYATPNASWHCSAAHPHVCVRGARVATQEQTMPDNVQHLYITHLCDSLSMAHPAGVHLRATNTPPLTSAPQTDLSPTIRPHTTPRVAMQAKTRPTTPCGRLTTPPRSCAQAQWLVTQTPSPPKQGMTC